ncbi:MAG: thrombospondin type 3 repeat-containing protein [Pseudomonadota bacterium]
MKKFAYALAIIFAATLLSQLASGKSVNPVHMKITDRIISGKVAVNTFVQIRNPGIGAIIGASQKGLSDKDADYAIQFDSGNANFYGRLTTNADFADIKGLIKITLQSFLGSREMKISKCDPVYDLNLKIFKCVVAQQDIFNGTGNDEATVKSNLSALGAKFLFTAEDSNGNSLQSSPAVLYDGMLARSKDTDGDEVPDIYDTCLNVANPDQADSDGDGLGDACPAAIPDSDGDGIPDTMDNCPYGCETPAVTPAANPDPDPDTDKDGIPDSVDKCPIVAGVAPDGCPATAAIPDTDKDGFPDSADKCPTVAGIELNGCPATADVTIPDGFMDSGGCSLIGLAGANPLVFLLLGAALLPIARRRK